MYHMLNAKTLETLACCQLQRMIESGKHVDECKREWYRRWKREYPLTRKP